MYHPLVRYAACLYCGRIQILEAVRTKRVRCKHETKQGVSFWADCPEFATREEAEADFKRRKEVR